MLYIVYGLLAWTISGLLVGLLVDKIEGDTTSRKDAAFFLMLGFIVVFLGIGHLIGKWFEHLHYNDWWNKPVFPPRSSTKPVSGRFKTLSKVATSVLICLPVAFCVWLCQIYSIDQGVSALVGTVLGQITGFVIFLIWWKE